MAITKEDIQNEGFEHSMRGYNVEQVDIFLERVAKEVDVMNTRIAELETQLANSKAELATANDQLTAANDQLSSVNDQLSSVNDQLAAANDQLAAAEATPIPEELEEAASREKEARAELEETKSKVADAILRAEEAENRMREAEVRAKAAEEQLMPLRDQLAEKNKLDSAIAEAFISAQRSAEQIKEEARAEGDRIYRESEAKAREFIRESLAKKASVNNEIETLQASMSKFKTEYIEMLGRFMLQAKDEFNNSEYVSVTDEEIDAFLPNIDEMPGIEEQDKQAEAAEAALTEDELPKLTAQQIPQINIPSVYPEDM